MPGECRVSTTFVILWAKEVVDARDKPGHDDQGSFRFPSASSVQNGLNAISHRLPVGVGEIAGIAAPERVLRLLHLTCTGGDCRTHRGVDFILAAQVLRERHAAEFRQRRVLHVGVGRERCAREERDDHAARLEERDILVARRVRAPAQPFVEFTRGLHVGDRERDQRHAAVHDYFTVSLG